jgi:hypothetical protein
MGNIKAHQTVCDDMPECLKHDIRGNDASDRTAKRGVGLHDLDMKAADSAEEQIAWNRKVSIAMGKLITTMPRARELFKGAEDRWAARRDEQRLQDGQQ